MPYENSQVAKEQAEVIKKILLIGGAEISKEILSLIISAVETAYLKGRNDGSRIINLLETP
jgi:hypothetical protein